jgi:hypothetical protein
MEILSESYWVYVDQSHVRTLTKITLENTNKERLERWLHGYKPISKKEAGKLFEEFRPTEIHPGSITWSEVDR